MAVAPAAEVLASIERAAAEEAGRAACAYHLFRPPGEVAALAAAGLAGEGGRRFVGVFIVADLLNVVGEDRDELRRFVVADAEAGEFEADVRLLRERFN